MRLRFRRVRLRFRCLRFLSEALHCHVRLRQRRVRLSFRLRLQPRRLHRRCGLRLEGFDRARHSILACLYRLGGSLPFGLHLAGALRLRSPCCGCLLPRCL